MSEHQVYINAILAFQNLPRTVVDTVSEPIDCGHVGGSIQGEDHKKLFFGATPSAINAAFNVAHRLGLKVEEMPPAAVAQEWSGKFADKGYRISRPVSGA